MPLGILYDLILEDVIQHLVKGEQLRLVVGDGKGMADRYALSRKKFSF